MSEIDPDVGSETFLMHGPDGKPIHLARLEWLRKAFSLLREEQHLTHRLTAELAEVKAEAARLAEELTKERHLRAAPPLASFRKMRTW